MATLTLNQFIIPNGAVVSGKQKMQSWAGATVSGNDIGFTGEVTLVTQSQGDNSTKGATTAYVDIAVAAVAASTFYTSDGTIDGAIERTATGINSGSWLFNSYNATPSTYTSRSQLGVSDVGLTFLQSGGDGAGGDTIYKSLTTLGGGGWLLEDTVNSVGATYAADYSTAGVLLDRWIPDYAAVKAYADSVGASLVDSVNSGTNITVDNTDPQNPIVNLDAAITSVSVNGVNLQTALPSTFFLNGIGLYSVPENLYNGDGTFIGNRQVIGNGTNLEIDMFDTNFSTWNTKAELALLPTIASLAYAQGDGAGSETGAKTIRFDATQMVVTDSIDSKGLVYAADYSSNFTDRSLVDKGFADTTYRPISTQQIFAKSEADLPAPVSGVISIPANTTLEIAEGFTFTFGNTLEFGDTCILQGSPQTTIVGLSATPFIKNLGALEINGLIIVQGSTGAIWEMDTVDSFCRSTYGTFIGGEIRMTSGLAVIFNGPLFVGCPIVQDATGGVGIVQLDAPSCVDDATTQRLIEFEAGSTTDTFRVKDIGLFQTFASTHGIYVNDGATLTLANISGELGTFEATATSITVENPDDVAQGTLDEIAFTGFGVKTSCQPNVSSTFAAPDTQVSEIGIDDDNNLLVSANNANTLIRMVGLTSTVGTTIAAPSTNPTGVTWYKGDLYSCDAGTDLVYQHDGFSTTILNSIATPGTVPKGIVFVGGDLVILDRGTDIIYVMDGFSATIKTSFAAVTGDNGGLTYDGENLIEADIDTVYVREGVSTTILYSFPTPTGEIDGITVSQGGFAIADELNDLIRLIDNPVSFDHSARTWRFIENTGGVRESSDRGGAEYSNTAGVSLTVVQDVWRTIDDAGTDIFWGQFAQSEKSRLNDETTGEIIWTGVRDKSQVFQGQAIITRVGGGAVDIFYQLAIQINGDVVTDSIGQAVLPTNNAFATVATQAVAREITDTDVVELVIRNVTNAQAVVVNAAKHSIT